MSGRDLKAEAVRAGLPLYVVAAAAGMNPNRLGQILNDRVPIQVRDEARIRGAIERLAGTTGAAR
jgi:hypothetical protein